MDFNVDEWCAGFLRKLKDAFGGGLVFVGLQGSRGRGEASEESDVDLVVVLKELSPRELGLYAEAVASMPFAEKACGFICGEEELRAWSASELFLLYHDTAPLYGSLDFIVPLIGDGAAEKALKDGACAIYHGCCHNRLYEKSMDTRRRRRSRTAHARYTTAAATTGFTKRAWISSARSINRRFLSCA